MFEKINSVRSMTDLYKDNIQSLSLPKISAAANRTKALDEFVANFSADARIKRLSIHEAVIDDPEQEYLYHCLVNKEPSGFAVTVAKIHRPDWLQREIARKEKMVVDARIQD